MLMVSIFQIMDVYTLIYADKMDIVRDVLWVIDQISKELNVYRMIAATCLNSNSIDMVYAQSNVQITKYKIVILVDAFPHLFVRITLNI